MCQHLAERHTKHCHCHICWAVQALRVLDNVMDTIIDQPVNPPPPWILLERCASSAGCHKQLVMCKIPIGTHRCTPVYLKTWSAAASH